MWQVGNGVSEKCPTTLSQVKSVDDIFKAKEDGTVGIILGFQNASPIENKLDRLELFHDLGSG